MLRAVTYLRGFIVVKVAGRYPERFLNICTRGGVSFWALKKHEDGTMTVSVRAGELPLLKELASNALCTVEVVRRAGAPFFALRFRRRYIFIACFLIFAAALYLLSQHIWEIEVIGNSSVSEERILKALEKLGVGIGTLSEDIDTESLGDLMLLEIDELSWFALNIHGCRASAEVREKVIPPKVISNDVPVNIVAAKSGMIEKITALEGSAQVAVGDVVTEGQLLVSGLVDTAISVRMVHAQADVTARVWYVLEAKMPVEAWIKEYTGEEKSKFALSFAGNRINLYGDSSIIYEKCDKIIDRYRLELPGGFIFPVTLIKETYREYEQTEGELDGYTSEEILKEILLARLAEQCGTEPSDIRFDFDVTDGVLTARLTAECIEQIARPVEIPITGLHGTGGN